MTSRLTLTGNASLISRIKSSVLAAATIPGANVGGTNLSDAFAFVQPRSEPDTVAFEGLIAKYSEAGQPFTAADFSEASRASREADQSKGALSGFGLSSIGIGGLFGGQGPSSTEGGLGSLGGSLPKFNLGDAGKKISEGVSSLGKKFTEFDVTKKFDKIATGAKTFLFGASPEAIAKLSPADAAKAKKALSDKAKGQATAGSINQAIGTESPNDSSHLVSLTDSEGYILEFLVMPEITENRTVEYEAVSPPQFPGAFQKYKGTASVQWTVNATLISRTSPEASKNLEYLNRLRGWTMPFYGDQVNQDGRFSNKLGAPPPVLKFKGFKESIIGPVPVSITSLNWNWPKDVDYIQASKLIDQNGTYPEYGAEMIPFPTVISIAIQLVESFSTEEFNSFDLAEYRLGHMDTAFKRKPGSTSTEGSSSVVTPPEAQEPPTAATAGLRTGTERGRATSAGVVAATRRIGTELGRATNTGKAKITEAVKSFKSGGGGDFGGGGASGRF